MKKFFILLLVLTLLIISGCSINVDTNMKVNNEFNGSRLISFKVPKKYIRECVNGSEAALDSLIKMKCPNELEWSKMSDLFYVKYSFTLNFKDFDDYEKKIINIIQKEPSIIFASSESPFSNGFRLEENFSSKDILVWVEKSAIEENVIKSDNIDELFKDINTVVEYNGRLIKTDDCININESIGIHIDKISIDTIINEKEIFERTVIFYISNDTISQAETEINEYMDKRVPVGGVGGWFNTDSGKYFRITFNAKNLQELNKYTNIVFDNDMGKDEVQIRYNEIIGNQEVFSEKILMTSFLSGNYKDQTEIEYNFTSYSKDKIEKIELLIDGEMVDKSDLLLNNRFSYSGSSDVFSVRMTSREEYSLENISIGTIQEGNGIFSRTLAFQFSGSKLDVGTNKMKDYFTSMNSDYTSVDVRDNTCYVNIKGTAQELNFAMRSLFGAENRLNFYSEFSFSPYNYTYLEDNINLGDLLNKLDYKNKLKYSYNSSMKLDSLELNGDSENDESLQKDNENYLCISYPYNVAVVARCSEVNLYFVVMVIVLFITLVLLITLFIFCLTRKFKERKLKNELYSKNLDHKILSEHCPSCGYNLYEGMVYCVKCGGFVGTIVEYPKGYSENN